MSDYFSQKRAEKPQMEVVMFCGRIASSPINLTVS